jgi:hypothetical protein
MAMEVPERGNPDTNTTGRPYFSRRTNPLINPLMLSSRR